MTKKGEWPVRAGHFYFRVRLRLVPTYSRLPRNASKSNGLAVCAGFLNRPRSCRCTSTEVAPPSNFTRPPYTFRLELISVVVSTKELRPLLTAWNEFEPGLRLDWSCGRLDFFFDRGFRSDIRRIFILFVLG